MRSDPWEQLCQNLGRLRQADQLSEAQLDRLGEEAERLYEAGRLSNDQLLQLSRALLSDEDFALIDAIAYGIARLINTPLGELAAEAGVQPTSPHWLTGDEVARTVASSSARLANTPLDQLAAEAQAHRASRALRNMPGHAGAGIVLQNPHDPPNHWYGAYEVRWLRGYPLPAIPPMIDGYPVKIVLVDDLAAAHA